MDTRPLTLLVWTLLLGACGASTGTTSVAARDSGHTDLAAPDTPAVADVTEACDPATRPPPHFCGCGRCDPAMISCAPITPGCGRPCTVICPEVESATCDCDGGVHLAADAGTDAATPADAVGGSCSADGDCAPGLRCCSGCGARICLMCLVPVNGECPAIP